MILIQNKKQLLAQDSKTATIWSKNSYFEKDLKQLLNFRRDSWIRHQLNSKFTPLRTLNKSEKFTSID